MLYLPVRKCYYIVKVIAIVVLVITVLALFEQWRGGRRSVRGEKTEYIEYEQQILEDEARIIPGLGEGGVAAHLQGDEKKLGEESEKKLAMNVYLSDHIAYNRTLKDHRNPACARVIYDAELPSASVILIFHNEPYSIVVRTLWSVVNSVRRDQPWYKRANFYRRDTGEKMNLGYPGQDPSSQLVYIKEIILVDDNSTLPELKGKLSYYVRTRLPPDLIRILRLPDRVGLTRARLAGARYATSDVLVFLDAHCEPQPDWLRPLLQRVKDSSKAVVMPIIDVIESSNFYYSVQDPVTFQVGGFTFTGHFTWIDVSEREKKRRGSNIAPTWSPTMAGGLFAMNRAYYWELGAYDEQMAGWGGENLEISFRIWQCGGTLETIPCSRVGHVFRRFHPYGLPASSDTHGINTARMAEVWMDDYAELFYMHRPDLRNNPKIGDVTHRRVLREKLKCKSFQWFLENIYPEKFIPVRDAQGFGRFVNKPTALCLDTLQRDAEAAPLGVYPCHDRLFETQYFILSLDGQLRNEEKCAEVQYNRRRMDEEGEEIGRLVLLMDCHGKRGQKWRYLPTGQLQHEQTQLCLDAGGESGADVLAMVCRKSKPSQNWTIDYSEKNDFRMYSGSESNEHEHKLRALRRQRRISRSLLSESDSFNGTDNVIVSGENEIVHRRPIHLRGSKRRGSKGSKRKRSRKRSKKLRKGKNKGKSKAKNKFILKLVRMLMNNSEEHLEVDIHCKHRQLYPNNSFVRDLVTILNERNIKVINNGRVFERNKVTQLSSGLRQKEHKVLNKLDLPVTTATTTVTTTTVTASVTPQHNEIKSRWRTKKRKFKIVTSKADATMTEVVTSSPENHYNGVNAAETINALDVAVAADHTAPKKRIIIEDFVEVKPTPASESVKFLNRQRSFKKRRRKDMRSTSPRLPPASPAAPAAPDVPSDVVAALLAPVDPPPPGPPVFRNRVRDSDQEKNVDKAKLSSVEDTLMVSSREQPGPEEGHHLGGEDRRENEDWAMGENRFRTNVSSQRRHSTKTDSDSGDIDSDDALVTTPTPPAHDPNAGNGTKHMRAQPDPTPVKLVMRSNLTFNLGDEFFSWRKNTDDINNHLDEVARSGNSTHKLPSMQAWVRPPTDTTRYGNPMYIEPADGGINDGSGRVVGSDKVGGRMVGAADGSDDASSSSSESSVDT